MLYFISSFIKNSKLIADLKISNSIKNEFWSPESNKLQKLNQRKHSPFVILHNKNTSDSDACYSSKTQRDESSLFSLNRSKFKRIFNYHSWRIVEDQHVIEYNELLKILKRLDVFPNLIAKYELKKIIQNKEEQNTTQSNKNLKQWRALHNYSSLSSLNMNINNDFINFKQFEEIFSKHLVRNFQLNLNLN